MHRRLYCMSLLGQPSLCTNFVLCMCRSLYRVCCFVESPVYALPRSVRMWRRQCNVCPRNEMLFCPRSRSVCMCRLCTIVILLFWLFEPSNYFNTPLFQKKYYCIPSIRTPTFEINIPLSEHLHLVELERGRRMSTSLQQSLRSQSEGYQTSSSILQAFSNVC